MGMEARSGFPGQSTLRAKIPNWNEFIKQKPSPLKFETVFYCIFQTHLYEF